MKFLGFPVEPNEATWWTQGARCGYIEGRLAGELRARGEPVTDESDMVRDSVVAAEAHAPIEQRDAWSEGYRAGWRCRASLETLPEEIQSFPSPGTLLKSYYSVIVPYSEKPTKWHPTEKVGPFSTLSRGAFPTEERAHEWAREHLENQPYTIKKFW